MPIPWSKINPILNEISKIDLIVVVGFSIQHVTISWKGRVLPYWEIVEQRRNPWTADLNCCRFLNYGKPVDDILFFSYDVLWKKYFRSPRVWSLNQSSLVSESCLRWYLWFQISRVFLWRLSDWEYLEKSS